VNITTSASTIGAITGSNTGRIENCYVSGTLQYTGTVAAPRIGGLAGFSNTGTIVNGVSRILIDTSTSSATAVTYAGRITGSGGSPTNCYAYQTSSICGVALSSWTPTPAANNKWGATVAIANMTEYWWRNTAGFTTADWPDANNLLLP
jgi:hypothetical protein